MLRDNTVRTKECRQKICTSASLKIEVVDAGRKCCLDYVVVPAIRHLVHKRVECMMGPYRLGTYRTAHARLAYSHLEQLCRKGK